MTEHELKAWQRRCGLRTDGEAAQALGISAVTYRRQRGGRAKISRQTELLCAYYEIFGGRFEHIAEAAIRLAHLTTMPAITLLGAPAAAEKIARVIGSIGSATNKRRD